MQREGLGLLELRRGGRRDWTFGSARGVTFVQFLERDDGTTTVDDVTDADSIAATDRAEFWRHLDAAFWAVPRSWPGREVVATFLETASISRTARQHGLTHERATRLVRELFRVARVDNKSWKRREAA